MYAPRARDLCRIPPKILLWKPSMGTIASCTKNSLSPEPRLCKAMTRQVIVLQVPLALSSVFHNLIRPRTIEAVRALYERASRNPSFKTRRKTSETGRPRASAGRTSAIAG